MGHFYSYMTILQIELVFQIIGLKFFHFNLSILLVFVLICGYPFLRGVVFFSNFNDVFSWF